MQNRTQILSDVRTLGLPEAAGAVAQFYDHPDQTDEDHHTFEYVIDRLVQRIKTGEIDPADPVVERVWNFAKDRVESYDEQYGNDSTMHGHEIELLKNHKSVPGKPETATMSVEDLRRQWDAHSKEKAFTEI
jgi:hypothetical protein